MSKTSSQPIKSRSIFSQLAFWAWEDRWQIRFGISSFVGVVLTVGLIVVFVLGRSTQIKLQKELSQTNVSLQKETSLYTALSHVDQKVRNDELQATISAIQQTYKNAVSVYESLIELKTQTNSTGDDDKNFAQVLSLLSQENYTSASAVLTSLSGTISSQNAQLAASVTVPPSAPQSNTPPSNGNAEQVVHTNDGDFLVNVIAADLNSTKVIVDTASSGTCGNNCPVDSLGDYASRSGAYAGINGPYFCPAEYPSCAGKTNSFDTLLMNKNKVYFNSDNNVYSTVPAVIFYPGSARFVSQSLQWGRDTSPDSVIASQPMLVSGGNVAFTSGGDSKQSGAGTRSFIGASGSTVYIGVVYNVNTNELAQVIHAMGIQNALNLDSGGSIALWSNGHYLAGPGRNTPFGILFVRR